MHSTLDYYIRLLRHNFRGDVLSKFKSDAYIQHQVSFLTMIRYYVHNWGQLNWEKFQYPKYIQNRHVHVWLHTNTHESFAIFDRNFDGVLADKSEGWRDQIAEKYPPFWFRGVVRHNHCDDVLGKYILF